MSGTGSKSKKWSMKKFRGMGWGYVIQNQISPNLRFPEVGISVHVAMILPIKRLLLSYIINSFNT